MDALLPWLAATIEGELGEALRHREDGTKGPSYDDGSNLRIPSAKKGPVVQVTKFLDFKEPIKVTLSDGVTRVNALITIQASQRHAKTTRRRLTEDTVGGLIQLLEFEIVATHLGPRDKRLTLYVKDFKSLGSNGSGNFGVAPQAIESREGTKELLNQLAGLQRHGSDLYSEQSATASPIRSQSSTQTSEAGNNQDSQEGFATQVPRSNVPIVRKPNLPGSTRNNVGSTSTVNSVKSLGSPIKGKHGNPLASTLSPRQVQAAPQRQSVSNKEALLGLLKNHKSPPPAPEPMSEPTIEQKSGRAAAASIGPGIAGKENETSRDITLAPGDNNTFRASVGIQKRKRHSPDNTPRKKAADKHEPLVVKHGLDIEAKLGAAATEASISTLISQPASPSMSESAKSHHKAPLEPLIQPSSKLTISASGQNTGRNRISSRDVRIPKDQEALLNHADSWLPAQPGQREPSANIPISILKSLNRKAGLHAQRPTNTRKQETGTMTLSAISDQTADSESDVPVSSGQWPSSPKRDQLPPDSSLESAEHSDCSIQKIPYNPNSISPSRRQSNASLSSHSMRSGRPSPISVRPFQIVSGSPKVVSPGLSSPSVISTSAGEELHRFACQVPGCDKSYKHASGLKYHKDHHHPDTGWFDNIKCPVTDCTKSYASPGGLKYHIENYHDGNIARSTHSGSATPTTSRASIPMFPGLKAWTNPGETHITKETLPPLSPASPTPESELEMTVPLALNENTNSIVSSALMPRFPSTASQPQDPFTQVKRTPYVNGRVQSKSTPESRTLSSPIKPYPVTNDTINDEVEFVSASVPSGPETSTVETHREIKSVHAVEDQDIGNAAARLAKECNSQEVTDNLLEKTDELIAGVQQQLRRTEAAANKQDWSHIMTEASIIAKANAKTQAIPETLPPPEDSHTDLLPRLPKSDHTDETTHEMKRKVVDSNFMSPSVAKRQKRFKVPSAFNFTEKSNTPRDPSEGARQIRQDFLASRRSSESSTPTMSPTMAFSSFTGAVSENPRDPSERARHIRQEFLASRRVETSTPKMSPKISLTALPGTIEPERQSPEVETNTGKVIEQKQSIHNDIEHEKMTELNNSSSRPQTQETELDAAPISNRTASVEPNGDDAKPSAQNNPVFDFEPDSLMFISQNADVEGPHAEESTVIEASSNDGTQGAQGVESDVYFESFNDQGAENDIANTKDGADKIAGPGYDMILTSQDRLGNPSEDSRPEGSEPDDARKDLSTGAGKGTEQKIYALTNETMSNQVAQPVTAALEHVHQQRSVEENAETQTSDKSASESTSHIESFTGNADAQILDEITPNFTSEQWLSKADTNTLMPDVQPDQEITPSKHLPHMGEPMNETTLPSFTALLAKSDAETQLPISSAVVEPLIALGDPISNTEMTSVEKHQNATHLSIETAEQKHSSITQNIFNQFKETYPAYAGNKKHFAAVCRKISQLVKENRMVHQSLWDDFIIRHKIEYSKYLRRCAEEAEDAVPYEDFYQTEVEEPQYQKRVINRRNLDEALALVARVEKIHVEPVKDYVARVESPDKSTLLIDPAIKKMHYDFNDTPIELVGIRPGLKPAVHGEAFRKPSESRVNIDLDTERVYREAVRDDEPRVKPVKAKLALQKAKSTEITQTPFESRVTIDLTEDDPPDEQPKSTEESGLSPQLSASILFNEISVERPPLQYRQDDSNNLYQVSYTPSALQGSQNPSPQSARSIFMPAMFSSKTPTQGNRRSLPWKDSTDSAIRRSSHATASDSPRRIAPSDLPEVRVKESGNADLQLSAKSTQNDSKRSQDLLDTYHKVIQSNWGLEAHELLEPEYYCGQTLSEIMIELLAEIASKASVREARNRIKEAIDTRIRDYTRPGAGHLSKDRKMLESDLEVVRGLVKTSSMSTTSPFSLPHTNAAVEKQSEGTPSKWWDDHNSPFKSFARAYTSIRHGNGNSFAKADPAAPGNAEKVDKVASSGVQLKKIDIMRWNL